MSIDSDEELLKAELANLRDEHRALDAEIGELTTSPLGDRIALQRMKKRKLSIKDRIARIEDQLYPDIIA
ncbi:MAG: DUF465 domain-containing protein [Pseudomonadota bacterium]